MILDSKEFIGKRVRVNLVGGGYVEGLLTSVEEEGGLLITDQEDYYDEDARDDVKEDVDYFVPRDNVLYYIYRKSEEYSQ